MLKHNYVARRKSIKSNLKYNLLAKEKVDHTSDNYVDYISNMKYLPIFRNRKCMHKKYFPWKI